PRVEPRVHPAQAEHEKPHRGTHGPRPARGPALEGRLDDGVLSVSFSNDSRRDWSACKLVYSDGRFYEVGDVAQHSDDTVLKAALWSPLLRQHEDTRLTWLELRCREGALHAFL